MHRAILTMAVLMLALFVRSSAATASEFSARRIAWTNGIEASAEAALRAHEDSVGDHAVDQEIAKSLQNGLYFEGTFGYSSSGNQVTLQVERINNKSSTRTTGTLRLEVWATNTKPGRGVGFSGYRLAFGSTLSPLPPQTYYTNVSRTSALVAPPDGTYWIVFVLSEYDSVHCPSGDGFCLADSAAFDNQRTFGNGPPPPPPANDFVTVASQYLCIESYPHDAFLVLQQGQPGVWQGYPPTTKCASLGKPYLAGYLAGTSYLVYTISDEDARALCDSGLVTGCGGGSGETLGSAVEYFHSNFGHYFVTVQANEIAALDSGTFGGWGRTGQTFRVWTAGGGTVDVCRFFTTHFAPKSSHFYTALTSECEGLKSNPVWQYETLAFKVKLPSGGACPSGTTPLFRLYNNGQSNAPNHRYTTSAAIRDQMIAAGFVLEDATVCVPN